jgi:hypothetical protein
MSCKFFFLRLIQKPTPFYILLSYRGIVMGAITTIVYKCLGFDESRPAQKKGTHSAYASQNLFVV